MIAPRHNLNLVRTAALLLLTASVLCAGDWTQKGANAARTKISSEVIEPPLSLVWNLNIGTNSIATPAIADGYIVVGNKAGEVRCYLEDDASLVWQITTSDEIISSPLIENGRVYIVSLDGTVRCVNLANGSLVWLSNIGGNHMSSPVIDGTTLYFAAGFPARQLRALSTVDGSSLWQKTLDQISYSSPSVANGNVYIGDNAGRFTAFNTTTEAETWKYPSSGNVGQFYLSAPMISGDFLYIVPGESDPRVYKIHKDSAQWGSQNADVTIVDPAPPAPGAAYSLNETLHGVSAPTLVDGDLCFLMRFDYHYNEVMDFEKTTDLIYTREFYVRVDPSTMGVSGPTLLKETTSGNPNDIPQLFLCPSPARFQVSGGSARVAVASSLEGKLRMFYGNSVVDTFTLDAPARSSPVVANARIYIATENGTLYCLKGSYNDRPSAVTSGTPSGNVNEPDTTPTLTWSGQTDPDTDAMTYIVRVDDDGEVLVDWDYQYTPSTTSQTLPTIAANTQLTWCVRSQDDDGALSSWSTAFTFWVDRPAPNPPTGLSATIGNTQITINWTASSSPEVTDYELATKVGAGSWSSYASIGNVTTVLSTGLSNFVSHGFRVRAVSNSAQQSSAAEIFATPELPVTIGVTPYSTLQTAAAAAVDGDTIQLQNGTYTMTSTVSLKEGVTLAGNGAHLTILQGSLNPLIRASSNSVNPAVIQMLTLTGATVAIDADGNRFNLLNLVVRDNGTGLLATTNTVSDVRFCTFYQNTSIGIHATGGTVGVHNNILMNNGVAMQADSGSSGAASHNCTYGNTTDYTNVSSGLGAIVENIIFSNSAGGDFRITAGQHSIDAADATDAYSNEPAPNGSRANMGAYGNTTFAATSGSLGSNGPPSAPTAGSPENFLNMANPATLTWSGALDPDSGSLTYIVRVDDDGEILLDYDYQYTPTSESQTIASYPADTQLTWSVRAVDVDGALSPWTTLRTFWADRTPPSPPTSFAAGQGQGQVPLTWVASVSPDVTGYELSTRAGAGVYGPYTSIGNVTSYTATGLTNYTTYGFRIRTLNNSSQNGTYVEVFATPELTVTIAATTYGSLQAALAASADGDTIQLQNGTYIMSSTLALKEGVTIAGNAPHLSAIQGMGLNPLISVTSNSTSPAVLDMLSLHGADLAVDANGNDITITNSVIRNNVLGILIPSASTADVTNANFFRNTNFGLWTAGVLNLRNCLISENGVGVYVDPSAVETMTYNNAWANTTNYSGSSGGTGSISSDINFQDGNNGDFRVSLGEPSVDAGDPADAYANEPSPNGNRVNMGAYGNTAFAMTSGNAGSGGPPTTPTTGAPENDIHVATNTPTLTWSGAADPDGGPLTYIVRADDDGEVLLDFDYQFSPSTESQALPSIASDTQLSWSVRAVDQDGALSPWATVRTFWVNRSTPGAPTNLTATLGDQQIGLSWTASASPDITHYELSTKAGSGAWSSYSSIGNVTAYTVTGLTNYTAYGFRIRTANISLQVSPDSEVFETPDYSVSIGATSYATLVQASSASFAGDTIQMQSATYQISGVLSLKEGVTLAGNGPHLTSLQTDGSLLPLVRVALNNGIPALIQNMTLSGGDVAVDTNNARIDITNVVIRNNLYGVQVTSGSDVLIKNVTFYRNSVQALWVAGIVTARNNIFLENGTAIHAMGGASITLGYNNMWANTNDYFGAFAGVGSIAADVSFLDAINGDFRVTTGSATIDAGDPTDPFSLEPASNGNRVNIGAYGNTTWAATSDSGSSGSGKSGSGGFCGMVGLDGILLLGLLSLVRRRRKIL